VRRWVVILVAIADVDGTRCCKQTRQHSEREMLLGAAYARVVVGC